MKMFLLVYIVRLSVIVGSDQLKFKRLTGFTEKYLDISKLKQCFRPGSFDVVDFIDLVMRCKRIAYSAQKI